MVPRIVESDDEFDELASTSDDGVARSSASKPSSRQPAAGGSRTSNRFVKAAPVTTSPRQQQAPPRPAARQAAIKANESMEVDKAVASDEDGGEEAELDELADEDEEEEEDVDGEADDLDDAEGEDEDFIDEEASTPGPRNGGHDGYAQSLPSTSTTGGPNPVKIKLKLGGNNNTASSSSPALPSTVISLRGRGRGALKGAQPGHTSAASSAKRGRKKGQAVAQKVSLHVAKRKRIDTDAAVEAEEEVQAEVQDEDDEEDFFSDDSAVSSMSMSKMTARQRAAHVGAEPDFVSLPIAPSKKKILTEDEVAMRKVETSRRRKHLLNKKLEEEKQETIERLLKKPIGRRGGASTSRIAAATKVDRSTPTIVLPINGGVDDNGQVISVSEMALHTQIQLPTLFRWVSTIKDGEYKELWGVPVAMEERFHWPEMAGQKIEEFSSNIKEVYYPPPRPPAKTRLFDRAANIGVAT